MTYLAWKQEYSTGNEIIDRQHRLLIDCINKLGVLLAETTVNAQEAEVILDFLCSYASTHFKHEEYCMQRAQCAAAGRNKAEHEAFTGRWLQFEQRRTLSGVQRDLLEQIHQFASEWIGSHILRIDIQLRCCSQ